MLKQSFLACIFFLLLLSRFINANANANKKKLTLSDGQLALPTNAVNFNSAWNATVDGRTGQVQFSVVLASMLHHFGLNRRDLSLGYSGSPTPSGLNLFDLGSHWQWNIAVEKKSTTEIEGLQSTDIITSGGHHLTMVLDRNKKGGKWRLLRHKLHDVLVTGKPNHWNILFSDGHQEQIDNGFESWEQTLSGHRVWFYYESLPHHNQTSRLVYLCGHQLNLSQVKSNTNACADNGIKLKYIGHDIHVYGFQYLVIHRQTSGIASQVSSILLPDLSSHTADQMTQKDQLRFVYDHESNRPWLLKNVIYPGGEQTTFLYNNESDSSEGEQHGLPVGLGYNNFPVVTEMIMHSSHASIPDRHIQYSYHWKQNHHNYTGYQGDKIIIPGHDNLLDRADSYIYAVTQDNGLTKTVTFYNKYHLNIETIQFDKRWNHIIGDHHTLYDPWQHTQFKHLPANYSLGKGSEDRRYLLSENSSNTSAKKINLRWRYDDEGRRIWQKDASGGQVFIEYCPKSGNEHCPKQQSGLIQNLPEKMLLLPSIVEAGNTLANPVHTATEIIYDYMIIPRANSLFQMHHKWVGMVHLSHDDIQSIIQTKQLPKRNQLQLFNKTTLTYHTNPTSLFLGQVSHVEVTHYPNDLNKSEQRLFKNGAILQNLGVSIEHKIDYKQNIRTTWVHIDSKARSNKKSMLNALSKGLQLGKTTYSLKTGRMIGYEDPMHTVRTGYHYDLWNRLDQITTTPLSTAAMYRPHQTTWQYIITDHTHEIVATDFHLNQQKIVIAGNKVVETWHRFYKHKKWIPDAKIVYTTTGKPLYQINYRASDPKSNIGEGKTVQIVTKYGYDSLNRNIWSYGSNHLLSVNIHDDADLWEISYNASSLPDKNHPHFFPEFTVIEANLRGGVKNSYSFSFNPKAQKKGHLVYGQDLQKALSELLNSSYSVASLPTLGGEGILPVAGSHGLLRFIHTAIKHHSWLTRTQFYYDDSGRIIKEIYPNGRMMQWVWNFGHLQWSILPDGRKIHDTFDLQEHLITRCVQVKGSSTCHQLGRRVYNETGDLLEQFDEVNNKISYQYDTNGRIISETTPATKDNPSGHTYNYIYTSLGLSEIHLDGHMLKKISYDPMTWRITDIEDNISHQHYVYDTTTGLMSKLISSSPKVLHDILPGYPHTIKKYRYNRYGDVIDWTNISGNAFYASHDLLGRTKAIKVALWHSNKKTLLISVTYDQFGRTKQIMNGLGIARTFYYDEGTGILTKIEDRLGTHLLLSQTYTTDIETGYTSSYTRKEQYASATQHYNYDLSGNLVYMNCENRDKNKVSLCPRDTDFTGHNITEPMMIHSQTYTFDAWNNIKTAQEVLTPVTMSKPKSIVKTVTYIYDNDRDHFGKSYDPHRMLGFQINWSDQNYNAKPYLLTYDNLGRLIKNERGDQLIYNAQGLLQTFIRQKNKEQIKYIYNSSGSQVAEQPLSSTEIPLQNMLYFFYDGTKKVMRMQKDKANVMHRIAELGNTAQSKDGVLNKWYLTDQKQDVLTAYNQKGTQIKNNVYSPYGMQMDLSHKDLWFKKALSFAKQNAWLDLLDPSFNNRSSDPGTGYQFLGTRVYNPVYRRFITHDSWSPFKVIDGYGFGQNNPIMYADPSGHMPSWAGYTLAGVSLAATLALGVLAPIALGSSIGAMSGIAAATVFAGVSSGGLQIAANKYPHSKILSNVNDGFMLLNNTVMLFLDAGAISATLTNVSTWMGKIALGSSITGGIASLSGMASTGIGLLHQSALFPAQNILNAASTWIGMTFTGASLASLFSIEKLGLHLKSGGNCFSGDTPILIHSKKQIAINQLHPGQWVMTAHLSHDKHQQHINKKQKEVTLVYKQTINSQQTIKPKACIVKNNHICCPVWIKVLATEAQIKNWQQHQKRDGFIDLFMPKLGIYHEKATIKQIKKIQWKKSVNAQQRMISAIYMRYANTFTYTLQNIVTKQVTHIQVTPEHRFYDVKSGQFIPINQMRAHSVFINSLHQRVKLLCSNKSSNLCGKTNKYSTLKKVYNLEIQQRHNYFAGKENILVHNGCYDTFYQCKNCGEAHAESAKFSPSCYKSLDNKHNLEQKFQCKACGFLDKTEDVITAHSESHEDVESEIYQVMKQFNYCSFCDHTLFHPIWDPYQSKIHKSIHRNNGYKIFCIECDKFVSLRSRKHGLHDNDTIAEAIPLARQAYMSVLGKREKEFSPKPFFDAELLKHQGFYYDPDKNYLSESEHDSDSGSD